MQCNLNTINLNLNGIRLHNVSGISSSQEGNEMQKSMGAWNDLKDKELTWIKFGLGPTFLLLHKVRCTDSDLHNCDPA